MLYCKTAVIRSLWYISNLNEEDIVKCDIQWIYRLDPTAQWSGQISQWQWKITTDHPTESDMSDYRWLPMIIIFHSSSPTDFTSDFLSNPPIRLGLWLYTYEIFKHIKPAR